MSAKRFIDSNIFLYAFCDKVVSKQVIAKDIILNGSPTISVQVINEVSNNLLKKLQFQENAIFCLSIQINSTAYNWFICLVVLKFHSQFPYHQNDDELPVFLDNSHALCQQLV